MTVRLDARWLRSVGLASLPAPDADDTLRAAHEALHLAVGQALAARMDDSQLREFEGAMAADDRERCQALLADFVPDHAEVVHAELRLVSLWVRAHARAILRSCARS